MMVLLHICYSISDASLLFFSLFVSAHTAVCFQLSEQWGNPRLRGRQSYPELAMNLDREPTSLMDAPLGITAALFQAESSRMEQWCKGTLLITINWKPLRFGAKLESSLRMNWEFLQMNLHQVKQMQIIAVSKPRSWIL